MQYGQILVGECAQIWAELCPVVFEKYVDGNSSVAFPPPGSGQIQKRSLGYRILYGAKVVNGINSIVLILYYPYVFHTGVDAQWQERVLGSKLFYYIGAQKY